jgi:hypothetical protein
MLICNDYHGNSTLYKIVPSINMHVVLQHKYIVKFFTCALFCTLSSNKMGNWFVELVHSTI